MFELLARFGGKLLERSVVEAVANFDVFEALHLVGQCALTSDVTIVFDEHFGGFEHFLSIGADGLGDRLKTVEYTVGIEIDEVGQR